MNSTSRPTPDSPVRPAARKAPRHTPAWNIARPLLLATAGLAAVGWVRSDRVLLIAAAAAAVLSGMIVFVVHLSYRRRVEQEHAIRCG